MEEQFLSIPKVAELLGISRIAIYKKVKRKEIEAIRIGRNYAIPMDYIRANIMDLKEEEDVMGKMEVEHSVKNMMKDFGDVFVKLGKQ